MQGQNSKPTEENKTSSQLSDLNLKDNQEKTYLLVSQIPHDWKFIVDTLKPIVERGKMHFNTLLWCIKTFNNRFDYNPEKNLENLKLYFSPLHWEKKSELENRVFPAIAELILETPALFPNKIPLFIQQKNQKVKLSKRQCACLVAHMFMCTTIQQDNQKLPHTPNFAWIFSKGRSKTGLKIAKIACVVNYLTRVCKETRPTFVVFERLVIGESHGKCTLEAWRSCTQPITKAEIRPKGKMEDANGAIETDFANKFLGGGVMGKGATQEEIQFITSPDLLIGVLLFEVLAENEAVLMKGAEIYCNYTGYKKEFRFESDYKDMKTPVKDDILDREIIAIDALNFKYPDALSQFSDEGVLRELNKAYVGFFGGDNKRDSSVNKPMSTGKWGCGVFRGNLQLKFLIQWLACSRARRDMYFYSCGDCNELSEAHVIMKYYSDKKVGELVEDVLKCCEEIEKSDKENPDLFGALMVLNSIRKEAV